MKNIFLAWQFWALLSAGFAALTAVFAVLFLGEKLTMPNWLGILLIAAGTVLVAWRA